MTRVSESRHLHRVTYENGTRMQETLVAMRQREEIADQLLLLEHSPVITLGRGGDRTNLLVTPAALTAAGVDFFETSRGGDITYHGPGQIVGYPIVHLGEGRRDIRKYVTRLEEMLIRTAADFGVTAERAEGKRGIWVGNDKLAAIGVRIARWVTSHGFAFNVNPNLSHFGLITPCGLHGTGVTSLARLLGKAPSWEEVIASMERHFAEIFEREITRPGHDLKVAKVMIHDGARVLLLRRIDTGTFWQPVTGRLESGESFEECARREMQEETGLTALPKSTGVTQSFLVDPAYTGGDRPLFVEEESFAAEVAADSAVTLDPTEHDQSGWFAPGEARELLHWSDDLETLRVVTQGWRNEDVRPLRSELG